MAITSTQVTETHGGVDGDGHRTYTAEYRIISNDSSDCVETVITAVIAATPTTWVFGNDSNANMFCASIGPAKLREKDASRRVWDCPVVYSTKPLGGDGSSSRPLSPFTSPTAEPWRISGSFVEGEKQTTLDRNGLPITTRGTEELKSFSVPYGHDTLHLEGASATISLSTRAQAVFRTNSQTIWGLQPRQLLLMNWRYDIKRHGTADYAYHVLDFLINYEFWTEKWINASFKQYNTGWTAARPATEKLVPILDKTGMPVHEPFPIDNLGSPVVIGSPLINEDEVIPEFDFTTLGFPDPLPGPFV